MLTQRVGVGSHRWTQVRKLAPGQQLIQRSHHNCSFPQRFTRRRFATTALLKLFQNQQAASSASQKATSSSRSQRTARQVIESYYEAYNAGNLDAIAPLVADDVSYHDMIYDKPFEGKQEFMAYLRKVVDILPRDLKFVIDDATDNDTFKVGIMWHVECGQGVDSVEFPFSRGCSFYTINDKGQIVQARDLVEPALKPGSSALKVLAAATPLVRQLGAKASPDNLSKLPIAAGLVWAFYAGYTAHIMLGTSAPGLPAWQTPPEVFTEIFNESLNFFYVNIALDHLGLSPVPSIASHPVSEALFNFVNAWSFMFLPVILSEKKCDKIDNKLAWWSGIMFLTNVFFIPFLAVRAAPEPEERAPAQDKPLPGWSTAFGAIGLAVGLVSVWWALEARPEAGDLQQRWDYFQLIFNSNRVFYAFVVDACLYSVWQATLLRNSPPLQRYVPFVGLAVHLLTGQKAGGAEEESRA